MTGINEWVKVIHSKIFSLVSVHSIISLSCHEQELVYRLGKEEKALCVVTAHLLLYQRGQF